LPTRRPSWQETRCERRRAAGRAARILEEGKATAEAVQQMRDQWADGGTQELFMIRMFPELVDKVTRVVSENLRVDKLTILDGGTGDGLPNYVRNVTNSAIAMIEQMKSATGIDLEKLARTSTGDGGDLPKQLD
jgi:flotillin